MNWIFATIVTATIAFWVTNIDDLIVLMLFFSKTNRSFQKRHIFLGQYLGFAGIVLISLIGFFGSLLIPDHWIRFLGLLPIAIGIKLLIHPEDDDELELDEYVPKHSFLKSLLSRHTYAVAGVTFANGGDNFGVYIPLFATLDLPELLLLLGVFLVMPALECYLAFILTRHPAIGKPLNRYSHIIVPVVLITLGIYILIFA